MSVLSIVLEIKNEATEKYINIFNYVFHIFFFFFFCVIVNKEMKQSVLLNSVLLSKLHDLKINISSMK